jgi:hypothetical protein
VRSSNDKTSSVDDDYRTVRLLEIWIQCQLSSLEPKVAVAGARGQFGNPEEGERPSLEAVTRELLKRHTEKTQSVLQ